MAATAEAILEFWFGSDLTSPAAVGARAGLWFGGDPAFDDQIRERFGDLPEAAAQRRLDSWRTEARSTLALVLILDQFPRNLHRGTARCFAYDEQAYEIACDAFERGFDEDLLPVEATFLYLPLEHSEDLSAQERCVTSFRNLLARAPAELLPQFESFLEYAIRHRDVVARFGRFPHRNAVLGRASTSEERSYLESGGDTFGGSEEPG